MVLVTYDVNTETREGRRRLRRVARICENYGQRVQHSVFECVVTPAKYVDLKQELKEIIDNESDSLRYYLMGKNWKNSVEMEGKKTSYNVEEDAFVL